MADYLALAQKVLQNRANIPNMPPWAPAAINAVMTGDKKAGEEIANSLLSSYGVSKEEVMSVAAAKLQELNLI